MQPEEDPVQIEDRLTQVEQHLRQSEQALAVKTKELDDAVSRIRRLEERLGEPSQSVDASLDKTGAGRREDPPAAPLEPQTAPAEAANSHDHMMQLPGGPALKIRGFFDLNFDDGQAAQSLTFPLGPALIAVFVRGSSICSYPRNYLTSYAS
jgi:hypothetical protein